MSHIFVSYSKKNQPYARQLAEFLVRSGFDVWIDDRIDYGDEWWSVIVEAIRHSSVVVVVMTPQAEASRWVQREVLFADDLNKPIFPLLRDGQNWPIFVGNQYVDVTDGSMPDVDFVRRLSQSTSPNPAGGREVIGEFTTEMGRDHFFDVHAEIANFFKACEAEDWPLALDHLERIDASGKAPTVFHVDAHRREVMGEQAKAEKQRLYAEQQAIIRQEYDVIRLMVKHGDSADRIQNALDVFWATYGHYDPDNLKLHYTSKLRPLNEILIELIANPSIPSLKRAEAGRRLGLMGDSRVGVGLRHDGLPDVDWVKIPPGRFLYGDETEGSGVPSQQNLPVYMISRYPVTVAQFSAFVEAGGYTQDAYWPADALRWRNRRENRKRRAPNFWDDPQWNIGNHPVVGVTWYEALAFSVWYSMQILQRQGTKKLKHLDVEEARTWVVRLPTEHEWEKAARGVQGRLYPWGDTYHVGYSNSVNENLRRTTAVGIFPHGASPYEVMDMSGNVWEWCMSHYDTGDNFRLTGQGNRVVRGGAWDSQPMSTRTVSRGPLSPSTQYNILGFRLVISR